jgi:hypothetical protein
MISSADLEARSEGLEAEPAESPQEAAPSASATSAGMLNDRRLRVPAGAGGWMLDLI